MDIVYRNITEKELELDLFQHFIRHQVVSQCWRKKNHQWIVEDVYFVEDWSTHDYAFLTTCLKHTLQTGGFVYGAFCDQQLKGFVSVESEIFNDVHQYCDLSSIHISQDQRGKGMGKRLFLEAKRWAKQHGAKKLYISAHSSVESQAFYKAMNCVEACDYDLKHVENEPFDCQLECVL